MTPLKSYRDLEVWKKSIDWVEKIYQASSGFPQEEKFGLTSQVRRAAVSVSANIAEGAARTGTGELLQSLSIAGGSLAEVETLLILAKRLGLLPELAYRALLEEADQLGRMLSGLKRSLHSKRSKAGISP